MQSHLNQPTEVDCFSGNLNDATGMSDIASAEQSVGANDKRS